MTRGPELGRRPGLVRLACGDTRSARAGAESVARDLRRAHAELTVEIVASDSGHEPDALLQTHNARQMVLGGRADASVCAWPDVPQGPAHGLTLAAIPMRCDPRDALVATGSRTLAYLPEGATVGTAEARQASQLRRRRGDLVVIDMPSDPLEAVAQLDAGRADAVVLQAWMVDWLGMLERVTEYFDTDQMIPAPGQAALAVEVRDGDEWSAGVLSALNDADTAYAVMAERACAARLRSAPRDPVGVFAITDGQTTFIHGIVATIDGTRATRLRWSGPSRSPVEVGDTLAELLESLGALDILAGGPLPPSIRYADRRRQLIEEWGDQDGPDA